MNNCFYCKNLYWKEDNDGKDTSHCNRGGFGEKSLETGLQHGLTTPPRDYIYHNCPLLQTTNMEEITHEIY